MKLFNAPQNLSKYLVFFEMRLNTLTAREICETHLKSVEAI